jgi:hypothetical protein
MKKLLHIISALALVTSPVLAAEGVEAGPRRGRILKLEGSKAEFFIEKDRKISIAFYDDAKKQQAPADQVITATAEAPSGKKKLEFEKKGELLVSKEPLPEGEGYNIVVQAKDKPDAKPKNFRIKLDLSVCKKCDNPEYACTCDE